MSAFGRNSLCSCGSGKKFKKCCLNSEPQKPASPWEMEARRLQIFKKKQCLHPSAGDQTCRGGIVKAHTVRRSADLKAIERGGHVYQGFADYKSLKMSGGRVVPKLVGINNASTFWGFCQAHDTSTFVPLETREFVPTAEQAFLLAYRPLVKELYLKQCQYEAGQELFPELLKGKPLHRKLREQGYADEYSMLVADGTADLIHHKGIYDSLLLKADYSPIRYVCIHLGSAPDVMCSGFIQPLYTFDGKIIQDLSRSDIVLEQMGFSLLATDEGGAAVFSWLEGSDACSSLLVDSLLELPSEEIPSALLRFAFSEFENSFARPAWWDSLEAEVQSSLVERMNDNTSPFTPLRTDCLIDDGVRAVDWNVLRVDQKRC